MVTSATKNASNASNTVACIHDRVIGSIARPSWLVNESLMDNHWIINTYPENVRSGSVSIDFEVVLAPGVRLTNLYLDLVTAKRLIITGLGSIGGRYSTGSAVRVIVQAYFAFLRWRLAKGIYANNDLTPDWISLLLREVATRGIIALPPYEDRLDTYIAEVTNGVRDIPTYTKGRVTYARMNDIYSCLGVGNSKCLPPNIRRRIDELLVDNGIVPNRSKDMGCDGQAAKERNVEDDGLSETRLITFFTPLQLLYSFRDDLDHDQIQFDPFKGEKDIASVARGIAGKRLKTTKTIPAYQACFLINEALTWITSYFDEIRDFIVRLESTIATYESEGHWRPHEIALSKRVKEDRLRYTDIPGSWWPIHPSLGTPPGWLDDVTQPAGLRSVLYEFLATAALLVLAAFSARRREELDSLKRDCIKGEPGEYWLECWISKNYHSLELIPVPTSAARAVEVLKWLSETDRSKQKNDWLLSFGQMIKIGDGKVDVEPRYEFYRSLDRFAQYVNVPPIDGERWVPKPTEYRRFFGMIYFHRYDFPSLIALSYHFRHSNPSMTRGYITETYYGSSIERSENKAERNRRAENRRRIFAADRVRDFEQAGLEYRMKVIGDAVTGQDYLTGFGGETIMSDFSAQVAAYKSKMELASTDQLDEPTLNKLLRSFAKDLSFEPHPAGHSVCKCTSRQTDLGAAACLKRRAAEVPDSALPTGPDLEFATPEVCGGCPHNLQRSCNADFWKDMLEHELHQSESALTPFTMELAANRAKDLQSVINRCHD